MALDYPSDKDIQTHYPEESKQIKQIFETVARKIGRPDILPAEGIIFGRRPDNSITLFAVFGDKRKDGKVLLNMHHEKPDWETMMDIEVTLISILAYK